MELGRKLSAVKILAEFSNAQCTQGVAAVETLGGVCSVLCCVVVSCEELKDESILFLTIRFALGIPGIHAKVSGAVRDVCS